jgi:Uma2 family endonuclease
MAAKARTYLAGGTLLVWVVWPGQTRIDVWHPSRRSGPMATLGAGGTLDGGEVLPGFTLPVADVFTDPLGVA